MRSWFLKTALFACVIASTYGVNSLNAQEVPLIGAFAGTGNDFAGSAFPIGYFSGVFDPNNGTAEWTARRGTLSNQTIRFDLMNEVAPNVFYYEQDVIFTGGTGRYSGVTGDATFVGFIDLATGEYVGFINGSLVRN